MEAKTRKMYDLNKCEMEKIREMPMEMRETRHAMGRMTGQVYDGARRSNAAREINVKSRREN